MAPVKLIALAAALAALCGEAVGAEDATKQLLTQSQVERMLRDYVLARGPWKADQLDVRVLSFKPVPLPPGKIALRVVKHGKAITPGVQSFLVAADVGGKEESKLWVRSEIKIFDQVVVSTRPLASREVITPEDVRLDWREIGPAAPRPYTKIEEVLGKQLARSTSVNEVLTVAQAELPQVVRHGSPVVLIYENSYLRVEAGGEALQGGKVGDTIKVKNPASGKLLQGTVLDARTVRVQ
jgi:flagellar basal body P-ring formation protein FlgA